jgi:hypothetical protein
MNTEINHQHHQISLGQPPAEKISISKSDMMRCIYSFFDKKHIDRVYYFIQCLDDDSKKNLPSWVTGNLENLLKYEKEYLRIHFNPIQFRKRLTEINPDFLWKNTINLNGGNAALDILLHTATQHGQEIKIIERIYADRVNIQEIETLQTLIKTENLQLKSAKSLGVLQKGDYYFCFDEYIENGRHPDLEEFQDTWHKKSIIHLWNTASAKFTSIFNEIPIDKKRITLLLSEKNKNNNASVNDYIENIFSISQKSRSFIYHSDLHRFNILILPKDDFRIIDWAGWAIAKVGMGYPVKRRTDTIDYFSNETISKIVHSYFGETTGVTLEEFAANFVLFNAQYSLDIDPELSYRFLNYFSDVFFMKQSS